MTNFQLPAKTTYGRPVKFYTLHGAGTYPIHGAVDDNGDEMVEQWTVEGKALVAQRVNDLVLAHKRFTFTRYVNVYRDEHGNYSFSGFHYTKESARSCVSNRQELVAVGLPVTIEGEEGYGIS